MTDLTKHLSSAPSSASINTITKQNHSKAIMPAINTFQHPAPLGVLPTNTIGPFPGLIPGLAGGLPAQGLINARPHVLTPSSTVPSHESTDERLNRLESLTAHEAQEIYSLRWRSSASCEEADSLRMRIVELEASLAEALSNVGQTPVSLNYSQANSTAVPPKWEAPVFQEKRSGFATFFEQQAMASSTSTPTRTADKEVGVTTVPQVKRSRYAALFAQMAATSANRAATSKGSQGNEVEVAPVLEGTPSTALTTHSDKLVTPPTTPIRGDSCGGIKVHDDPFPWGDRFGRPDLDFAASIPMTSVLTPVLQCKQTDVYGWPLAPHFQEMEEDADPFPWGRRNHEQVGLDFAASIVATSASTLGDPYGKEAQAHCMLHAPQPIRPRAPLLSRTDFSNA